MKHFTEKHKGIIKGVISCFDRVVFKGHLPLGWAKAMEQLLQRQGLLIKDFKNFVEKHSVQIKNEARKIAANDGRPYEPAKNYQDKDDTARDIAKRDGITEGLVCILTAVESIQSFKVVPGELRPRIINAQRKCLCLYFYYIDPDFGLIHVRLPTWFPFPIQICMNGHEFLARRLKDEQLTFKKCDNAFHDISDYPKAQAIANQFIDQDWPKILSKFAESVNPLMLTLLNGMQYYWVIDQAEFASDVIFENPDLLNPLYENLVDHAITCFSAEDVMTFLGRKLSRGFAGEIVSHYKKRWPGTRIKHRMKKNWIKMYDKHGCVLRVETVINNPYEFKVRRHGKRKGQLVLDWFPMAKGVANMYRFAEVSLAANSRYLEALAEVPNPDEPRAAIRIIGQRHYINGRSYRGFNPLNEKDIVLFAAVCRGENIIRGFCNRDIREHLYYQSKMKSQQPSKSSQISRLLKLLHVHSLIAKIPRTRRWKVTKKGFRLMSVALKIHKKEYPELLAAVS